MKIMAIDYGTKRVGVALSYASLAQPLTILPNDDQLLTRLVSLIDEHQAEQVVVGLSENDMARRTRDFVARLQQATSVPLVLADETLTSFQVHEWLKTAPAQKRRGPIDHWAAAVILENYMASQRG